MTKSDLYWLAGLLEGEGCFTSNRQTGGYIYLSIQLVTADRDVLEKVVSIAGGTISGPFKTRKPHHSPMFQWKRGHKDSRILLKKIFPLMSIRRKEQIVNSFVEVEGSSPDWTCC